MKVGILLMNTGTADEPTVEAVARYLGEFLMDPAIIAAPTFIRKPLVRHICASRPQRTVHNYKAFWTPDGSPFMIASRQQRDALKAELIARGHADVRVALAMRYGNPGIAAGLEKLREEGCERVVLLPCYPFQVNVCAGTCLKEARDVLKKLGKQGWKPEVAEVPSFCEQPAWQQALAQSVRDAWSYKPGSKLLVSCHSTLLADIEHGDPYRDQIEACRDMLARELGVPAEDALTCYQSRFDSRKWLQPFTEATVLELAAQGVRDICILCPIFTAENMETALEIDRDLRATYLAAAGQGASFTYVHTLDAAPGLINALADAVEQALGGSAPQVVTSGLGADTSLPGMLMEGVRTQR
jgi:protoporphyrin/coproporphyrin ferrochelatase